MAALGEGPVKTAYLNALVKWNGEGILWQPNAARFMRSVVGITTTEAGRLMYEFVKKGGEIDQTRERRPGWRDWSPFHYDLRMTMGDDDLEVYIETRLQTPKTETPETSTPGEQYVFVVHAKPRYENDN